MVIVVGVVSYSFIGNSDYALIAPLPVLVIAEVFSHRSIGAKLAKLHALAERLPPPPPDDQRKASARDG